MRMILGAFVLIVSGWMLLPLPGSDQPTKSSAPRLRRPVALLLTEQGKKLLVANRDSGTIAIIDPFQGKIVAETRVAERLADLTGDNKVLVAVDEQAHEVVVLDSALKVQRRSPVGHTPVCVRLTQDSTHAVVSCLWPRRLAVVPLQDKTEPVTIDLPFAPRRLLAVDGQRVVVADAFAGRLAVVNVTTRKIESIRNLPVHNIRDLALSRDGKHVMLTHQTLNARGQTRSGDIQTSNVLTNNVRKFALADILDPLADLSRDDRVYQLGGVEKGAGDPTEIAESFDGQVVVTLAGVNEIALGRPDQAQWTHFEVGRRPTALALDRGNRRAYIANTFADAVTVFDLANSSLVREIPLAPPVKDLASHERGEMLFFDARLSFESWYSCHSCHTDGHTTGRLNDNFSDGSFGTPKRILTLLGARDTGPWAWNAQMTELEAQVRTSIKSTMQGRTPSAEDVRDLTAFVQTLPAAPSLLSARGIDDPETVKRGRKVFVREKCASCHAAPSYTSAKTYDVGLHDEAGGKLFNPPSLRGVSQAGPYFHDNRAATLEDVFVRFRHQLPEPLTTQELSDLLRFLESL